jgi:hypothetical protein
VTRLEAAAAEYARASTEYDRVRADEERLRAQALKAYTAREEAKVALLELAKGEAR